MQTKQKHNHPDAVILEEILPEPGRMMEYGWYEETIEDEIRVAQTQFGLNRTDAIIKVFRGI